MAQTEKSTKQSEHSALNPVSVTIQVSMHVKGSASMMQVELQVPSTVIMSLDSMMGRSAALLQCSLSGGATSSGKPEHDSNTSSHSI